MSVAPPDPADAAVEAFVGAGSSRAGAWTGAFGDARWVNQLGVRGATRTIYVRTTGSDTTGDGKTTSTAFREIKTAVDSLADDGPVVRGTVVVDVGAGTYKGGIRLPQVRGRAQDDYITIKGPATGGHPNVPTAIIDFAADATATWGVLAEDGATLWLEDLKFIGAFPNGVRIERGVFMQWRNVHIDGQNTGTNGASIQHQCRYIVLGGIVENLTGLGIFEAFGCTRSFSNATANSQQMIIRNCDTGLQAKEAGVGHLDYLNVEDCLTGVELNGMCVANLKGVSLKRNDLGLAVVNSEVHNASSMVWGSGVDANTREYMAVGSSAADLTDIGWTSGAFARTSLAGHRPMVTLAASYADATVTGVTTETQFYSLLGVIQPHRYNVAGRRLRVVAWGSVNAAVTTATGYRILLRFGTQLVGEARVPQTAVVGDDFRVEFEIVCSADGNAQKVLGTVVGYPSQPTNYATRTIDMTSQAAQNVGLYAIPGATTESVTMRLIEVWG